MDLQCPLNGELSEGRKAFRGLRYKVRIPLLHEETGDIADLLLCSCCITGGVFMRET